MYRARLAPIFVLVSLSLIACGPSRTSRADRDAATADVAPEVHVPPARDYDERRAALKRRGQLERDPEQRAELVRRLAVVHLEEAAAVGEARAALLAVGDRTAAERLAPREERARRETMATLDRVEREFPQFSGMDAVLYTRASALLQAGEDERARTELERFLRRFPDSELQADVYLDLGDLHFAAVRLEEAAAAYDRVIALPESELAPYALYKRAWCALNLGQQTEALALFRRVVDAPIRSPEGPAAALQRAALYDMLRPLAATAEPTAAAALIGELKLPHEGARISLLVALGRVWSGDGRADRAYDVWGIALERISAGELCDADELDVHRRRFLTSVDLGLGRRALVDLRAWNAASERLGGCLAGPGRADLDTRRAEGRDTFREVAEDWRAQDWPAEELQELEGSL